MVASIEIFLPWSPFVSHFRAKKKLSIITMWLKQVCPIFERVDLLIFSETSTATQNYLDFSSRRSSTWVWPECMMIRGKKSLPHQIGFKDVTSLTSFLSQTLRVLLHTAMMHDGAFVTVFPIFLSQPRAFPRAAGETNIFIMATTSLRASNKDLWIRPTVLSWLFPILVTICELLFKSYRWRSIANLEARDEAKKQKTQKSKKSDQTQGYDMAVAFLLTMRSFKWILATRTSMATIIRFAFDGRLDFAPSSTGLDDVTYAIPFSYCVTGTTLCLDTPVAPLLYSFGSRSNSLRFLLAQCCQ